MSRHSESLARARKALLEGRPAECERELLAFEALLAQSPPDDRERDRCARLTRELQQLAAACADGAASACSTLAEAVEAAGHLTTYDAGGARARRPARPQAGRAF